MDCTMQQIKFTNTTDSWHHQAISWKMVPVAKADWQRKWRQQSSASHTGREPSIRTHGAGFIALHWAQRRRIIVVAGFCLPTVM